MKNNKFSVCERISRDDFKNMYSVLPYDRESYYNIFHQYYNLKKLPDFPLQLMLEVTNNCNFDCAICTSTVMSRKKEFIKTETALKIIKECGKNNLYWLGFHIVGEPLLHKDIFILIEEAKKAGIPVVNLTTNGYLIDSYAESILNSELDSLVISFSGNTPEQYAQIYHAKNENPEKTFQKVSDNIRLITLLKKKRNAKAPFIQLNSVWPPDILNSELDKFKKTWEKQVDAIRISYPASWIKGNKYNNPGTVYEGQRYPCKKLWRQAAILSSGDVTLCCLDADGDLVYDSIIEKSLKEVWHSQKHLECIKSHLMNDYKNFPFCSLCHDGWF